MLFTAINGKYQLTYKGIKSVNLAPDHLGAAIAWANENWEKRDSAILDFIAKTKR